MNIDPDQEKLDSLTARIREASAKPVPDKEQASGQSSATRIGFDFMGAVVGSAILGVVIDHVFETKPWGVIILVVVGFLVGIMNVWKGLNGPKSEDKPV